MGEKRMDQVERINRYAKLIEKQTGRAVRPYRADGYMNLMTKYGTSKDSSSHWMYAPEPTVPDETMTRFYEGNGLFAKIIDAPAEEAIKHGFKLDGIADEKVESFYEDALEELDVEEHLVTGIKWARLFGGAIGVILVNDGRGLDEPLDWKNIKSVEDIKIYDRSVVTPDWNSVYSYDPSDDLHRVRGSRLGMPEYYYVSSRYGSFTVHESRCLVFQNGILPENTVNSIYQLWGMPEYIRIHKAIRDSELAHSSASKMLDRSVQPVHKMKNLSELLATEQGENLVLKRLQVVDMARGMLNTIAIDSDGEDYDFRSFQFSGVPDVIDSTCNFLSALTNIPQSILFGRAPQGMSDTGEGDQENWYSFVERIQKRMLKGNLRYLLAIIFQAGMASGEIDEVPKIKIEFNPLWTMSDVEKADLELKNAQIAQTKAQTVQIYVDMQAIDPSEVRKQLASSDEFDIDTILDEIDEEDLMSIYEQQEEMEAEGSVPPSTPDSVQSTPESTTEKAKNGPQTDLIPESNPILNGDEKGGSVGIIVIKDGKILCGKRHNDFGYGLYCGPGGHIEDGEDPETAAIREAKEEFKITPKELIPMGRGPVEPDTGLEPFLYLCTEFEGEPETGDLEIVDIDFRNMEELDQLSPSLFQPFKDAMDVMNKTLNLDGGPGSGNFNHAGRPGKKGGSAKGHGLKPVETIDFNDGAMVESTIRKYEQEIVTSDVENAVVITTYGKVYLLTGGVRSVDPTPLGGELEGCVMTHNHPSDETYYSFSHDDVNMFINHGVQRLRGVDDTYEYEMIRRPDTKMMDLDTITHKFGKVYRDMAVELESKFELDADEDEYDFIVRKFAEELNFDYRRKSK